MVTLFLYEDKTPDICWRATTWQKAIQKGSGLFALGTVAGVSFLVSLLERVPEIGIAGTQ